MKHSTLDMLAGILDGIRPEPQISVNEWADQHRRLSSKASAEPGPWRTSRVPYMREIGEAMSPHSGVEMIIAMKGSQVAFSEMAYNMIGYYVHNSPCPILLLNPTNEVMLKNSKMRIAPMFDETPVLKDRISKEKSRSTDNSILFKSGPGWVLSMAGTNTPNSVSSMACRVLVLDEVDRMPDNIGKEGSPLDLAKTRTNTFGSRRKMLVISTPTTITSKIKKLYETTDQRMYHVPCPDCGEMQVIEWENMEYTKLSAGRYHVVLYCVGCGVAIEERHKTWMLENGRWISLAPQNSDRKVRGYHLSALYSPVGWLSWEEIAQKHDIAYNETNDALLKQTFENTILGRVYEEEMEKTDWQKVRDRAGNYKRNSLPDDGPLFITAGADVQRDRIEVEVVAWGEAKRSWSVDYRVIHGNTSNAQDGCWKMLEEILDEKWICTGAEMPIAYMCIDSSDQTKVVYDVVNQMNNRGRRVLPIKGVPTQLAPIKMGQGLQIDALGKKRGRPIWLVGVNTLKDEVMGFLRSEMNADGSTPPGFCEFPDYPEEYFKGLLSEAKVVTANIRGQERIDWKVVHKRNEPLDCRNYARAAAEFGNMINYDAAQMQALRGQLSRTPSKSAKQPAAKKPAPKKPRRPSIWED